MMNVHHLELFYYVAKYEGITAAVRKMPYGIQQPAVSGQILQLEEQLGVKLFNRRPFALTSAGEELYDFAYPFFSRLSHLEERLKGEESQHLRIAASASVLRNHLPEVLESLKLEEPGLKLTLREVEPADISTQLTTQQVDLAISLLHGKEVDSLRVKELLELPLVLYVPSSIESEGIEDLVMKNPDGPGLVARLPLVGLPQNEVLSQVVDRELERRGVKWNVSVEVNSLDVVQRYVSRGFGAAIGVVIPGVVPNAGVRQILLDDFPCLKVGITYQGSLKPMAKRFVEIAQNKAKQLRDTVG